MASAENANDLGAPASGFGQNVTFAFKPGGVPDQQQLLNATPVEGSVEYAGTRPAVDHTVQAAHLPEDHTFEMLNRVAQEAMAPSLKAKRTEAYVSGMQAVAQGEAVNDIVQNQPWYSKIFGDSDVVAGARAYAGHAKAADTAAALEDLMPSMRSLSPTDAQKVFTKTLSDNTTGDAATDAQVYQSLSTQLPALMRRQAKEHYGWLQAQAADAEGKSAMSGARALQAAAQGTVDVDPATGQYRPGATKPEEFAAQQQDFVRSLAPTVGRDLPNWQISTAKTLTSMAKQGYFHGLAAADKAGLLDALTSDQAEKLRDTWADEEKAHRATNEGPYLKQMADVAATLKTPIPGQPDSNMSIDQAIARWKDINSAYTAQSGSRIGIVSDKEMLTLATDGIESIRKERIADIKTGNANAARMQAGQDKIDAEARQITYVQGALKNGWALPEGTATEAQKSTAFRQEQAAGQPGYMQMVGNAFKTDGTVDKAQSKMMQASVNATVGSKDPSALVAMYQNLYLPMQAKGGDPLTDAYMGSDLGKKMRVFDSIMKQDPNGSYANAAYNTAFVLPLQTDTISPSDKDDKALTGQIKSLQSHWMPQVLAGSELDEGIDIRPDQLGFMAGLAKKQVLDSRMHVGDEQATNIVMNRLTKQGGLQVSGGYAWLNAPGNSDLVHSLNTAGIPINRVGSSLRDALDLKAKQTGLDTGNVQLMRADDGPQGLPRFVAMVSSKDGTTGIMTLDGDEIKHQYLSNQAAAADRKAAVATPFTTPGNDTATRLKYRPNLVGADPRANAPQ